MIDAYTSLTGASPNIVMWYQQWSGPYSAFYSKGADAVRARGATPLISWEPWAGNKVDPTWSLSTIISGDHDAYIAQWTHDVAVWGQPIYVRPMYEMNGDWTAWSPTVNGNTPAHFISAWRHIVDIARAQGATNIRWVWAPNIDDGNPKNTPMADVYPGDAYVDWLGLDGYNWGSLPSGNGWQTFTQVFQSLGGSYSQITALSTKPLIISEVSSTELAGNKAAWITSAFATEIPALARIKAVIWFDANKETDWRVNSTSSALSAFRTVTGSSVYSGLLP